MAMAEEMATSLIEGLTEIFDNQTGCDVVFIVEGKRIGAHKVVLAIQSLELYEMASGWHQGSEPIPIEKMTYKAFEEMLRYLYCGEIYISGENRLNFLSAAALYKIHHLEKICVDHITKVMDEENICVFINEAIKFGSTLLQEKCFEMFKKETHMVLQSLSFTKLSQPALSALLDVDQSNILEIMLFYFLKRWMEQQCQNQGLAITGANMRNVIGDAIFKIRFPTMTMQDFANSVATIDGLLTDSETAQIFKKIAVFDNKYINCPFSSRFRCQINDFYSPFCDMIQLSEERVLNRANCDRSFDLTSMVEHVKSLPHGDQMLEPSFLLLLQCCADMANSSALYCAASATNQSTRVEFGDCFQAWKSILETENVCGVMTKYIEIRAVLNNLYRWTL